mmetsp:Transcript_56609/g.132578  ORF Transcript_56609/g.132578 Transcript_56609/m.132578 type:complete len:265 (-) Transcript_56609:3943-4737(-)
MIDVTVPCRNADVGSAAWAARLTASAAGDGAETELGSARMMKVMMMDPGRMESSCRRVREIPRALATSSRKLLTKVMRSGLPSGIVATSMGRVVSTDTGAGFSLTLDCGLALVLWPPPLHVLPTVRMMSPVSTSPVRGISVQIALRSVTTLTGVHGMGVAPCIRPVTTDEFLPKLRPVMVMLTGNPASSCAGCTIVSVGGSNRIQLFPTAICSCVPLWKCRIKLCLAPTHDGDWHVMRVPSTSLTTKLVHFFARPRSTLPTALV